MSASPARAPHSVAHGAWGGYAAGLGAAAGFSLKAVFVKAALTGGADALTVLALRMAFSLPIFVGLAFWAGARGITRRDAAMLVGLGFTGYYLSSLFDMLGLEHISAGLERVVLFSYPTLTVLFATLLGRERFTRRVGAALFLSYAGLVVSVSHDLTAEGEAREVLVGMGWVFAAAVTYASYLTLGGDLVRRLGSLRMTAYATTVAAFFALGHYAAVRPLSELAAVPLPILGWAVLLAVFSTALPIGLQAEAVRRIGAGRASLVGALGPVLTLLFAAVMLGEPVSGRQLAGSALVIGGVTLLLPGRPR